MIVPQVNAVGAVPMAITGKTTLPSYNASALLTKTKDEPDTYRFWDCSQVVHSTRVDIMGVQEPHVAAEDQLWRVPKALGRYNSKIHCA